MFQKPALITIKTEFSNDRSIKLDNWGHEKKWEPIRLSTGLAPIQQERNVFGSKIWNSHTDGIRTSNDLNYLKDTLHFPIYCPKCGGTKVNHKSWCLNQ